MMGYKTKSAVRNRSNILILGASSFVGNCLYQKLGIEFAVGTYYKNSQDHMRYFDSVRMDVNDIIEDNDTFTHAVILLGDTQPDSCFTDIIKSNALNVESVINIIDVLVERSITPIFISSQFVFDGENGEYIEEDGTNPILVYGKQKLCIEEYLQEHVKKYLVLRLAKVYGNSRGDGTLFTAWMDSVRRGVDQITCAKDQRFSPIYVEDVADAILATINNDCLGTYHVAGPKAYSRVELLMMLLGKLNERIRLEVKVDTCNINDFELPELRPIDVSMNPSKLIKDTGIILQETGKICDQIISEYLLENKNGPI